MSYMNDGDISECECNEKKFDFHVYMERRSWLHIAPFQGQCDRVQGLITL